MDGEHSTLYLLALFTILLVQWGLVFFCCSLIAKLADHNWKEAALWGAALLLIPWL